MTKCLLCRKELTSVDLISFKEDGTKNDPICLSCRIKEVTFINEKQKRIVQEQLQEKTKYLTTHEDRILREINTKANRIIRDYENAKEVKKMIKMIRWFQSERQE